jgi:hypothetical protein
VRQITYKREGDGFQCEAICDHGYMYAFWFQCAKPPEVPEMYKHYDLSPTAKRVVWLALQLPNCWTRIYIDNLFNSHKLFMALYQAKALGHGVVRPHGRGMPPQIVQMEEKNVAQAERLRGTTKAVRMIDSRNCPDLLAASVYDTKPVHLLSMVSDCVE